MSDNHMETHLENSGDLVKYDEKLREYYLLIKKIGNLEKRQEIAYCPWCGEKFPGSLREKWFDRLEAMGIDPIEHPHLVPKDYKSDSWWKDNGIKPATDTT